MAEAFFKVHTVAMAHAPYRWHHEPGVAKLPNDSLLAVWGATGRGPVAESIIVGSFSYDHGCTWNYPVVLASDPERMCMDPGLLVYQDRVFLDYSLLELAPYLVEDLGESK